MRQHHHQLVSPVRRLVNATLFPRLTWTHCTPQCPPFARTEYVFARTVRLRSYSTSSQRPSGPGSRNPDAGKVTQSDGFERRNNAHTMRIRTLNVQGSMVLTDRTSRGVHASPKVRHHKGPYQLTMHHSPLSSCVHLFCRKSLNNDPSPRRLIASSAHHWLTPNICHPPPK